MKETSAPLSTFSKKAPPKSTHENAPNKAIPASQHGGTRVGAGRKKGSSPLGETTKVIRVPESKAQSIKDWLREEALITSKQKDIDHLNARLETSADIFMPMDNTTVKVPIYLHKVVAGFPSPAEDYIESTLDLNEKLIQDKNATFILKVQGDSMKNVGIFEGDLLIVDRSIRPTHGKIVIAALNGELTVKRLSLTSKGTFLVPENDAYPVIKVSEESEFMIWGVVTSTIHQF